MKLLSVGHDSKTIKGEKYGYLTGILYLAPANVAGSRSVCPFSTVGCRRVCLYTAGRGGFNMVQQARIRKTKEWLEHPKEFLGVLEQDIKALIKQAEKRSLIPAVRLNGTSDIQWENYGIMEKFPSLQFYDYTKFPPSKRNDLPANYNLTFSLSEKPNAGTHAIGWRMRGVNTAVVFFGALPSNFALYDGEAYPATVINGDESDLRFTDPHPCIVGLKVKGKARKDDGDGFVQKAGLGGV